MLKHTTRPMKPQKTQPHSQMDVVYTKTLHERRIKLTGHSLRADNCDPIRQESFRRDSAAP